MSSAQTHLLASFPWLTPEEVSNISEQLRGVLEEGVSAIDQMRSVAAVLESSGLPPTSSLLLSIVGRGSKNTAVQIARDTARKRFEQAKAAITKQAATTAPSPGSDIDAAAIVDILRKVLSEQTPVAPAPATSPEILELLSMIAGDVRWLKSTIDTERQLRRYQETYGHLREPGVTPTNPQERRTLVASLTGTLERDRFKGSVSSVPDDADGHEG